MKKLSLLATGLVFMASAMPVTAVAQTYYDEYEREIPRYLYYSRYVSPTYLPEPVPPRETYRSYAGIDPAPQPEYLLGKVHATSYLESPLSYGVYEVDTPKVTGTEVGTLEHPDPVPKTSFLPAESDRCETDSSLRPYAKERVALAANDILLHMQAYGLEDEAQKIKREIEDTSLKTGGKLRDIYVGGASAQDKRGMVEEYLRKQLRGLEEHVIVEAERHANDLLRVAEVHLNQPATMYINKRGTGSASRSISNRGQAAGSPHTRSGSFKLQQRGILGLHEDVGRFNYTVTTRYQIRVSNLHFRQQYDACPDPRRDSRLEFGARVSIRPVIEVEYSFKRLGRSSMSSRYRTFSGSFYIVNRDQEVTRELETYRPL